jgi:hypothetical protein
MPEPITGLLFLAGAKIVGAHVGHAAAAKLLIGVAAGTVLYSICRCLKRLVEGGIFSKKQAEGYKSRAKHADKHTQKEMLSDAEDLCEKYGV